MAQGSLALVLHAHLPYVRHPEHERFLEEDWLYEAIVETYLPLLEVFEGLVRDRVPFRISMTMSPPLVAMLRDDLLRSRAERHLLHLSELVDRELERTVDDPHFHYLARHYRERLDAAITLWRRHDGDLVRAFGQNGVYAPICAADWAKSLSDIAGLAVDLVCKFPISALKLNPNQEPDSARDIVVKVNNNEMAPAGWNYNCPEQGASYKFGSVSFDAASCPALNARMQFIYEPAPTTGDGVPLACGAATDGGTGSCPTGFRCGNCNYCEKTR